MNKYRLQIAPEKCEVVLLKSHGYPKAVYFRVGITRIEFTKTIKYLGVTLDNHGTFGQHAMVVVVGDEKASKLARLMPNIRGSSSAKRVVLLV